MPVLGELEDDELEGLATAGTSCGRRDPCKHARSSPYLQTLSRASK